MHGDFKSNSIFVCLLHTNKMSLVLPRNFRYDLDYETDPVLGTTKFMGRIFFTADLTSITVEEFVLDRPVFDEYLTDGLGLPDPLLASFDLVLGASPPFSVTLTLSIPANFAVSKNQYTLRTRQTFYGPTSTTNIVTTLGLFNLGDSTLQITENGNASNYDTIYSQLLLPPNFPDSTTEISLNWIVFTIFAVVISSIAVYAYFPTEEGRVRILKHTN